MKKFFKIFLFVIFAITITGILSVAGITIYNLTVNKVDFSANKIYENTTSLQIYNNSNVLIKEDNLVSNKKVKINNIPSHVKNAFISIEDKEFYKHKGINPKRMIKAFLVNLKSMNIKQGASTITQQLIKNTHLSNQKTLNRKINEIALSLKLEKQFTKDQILESYLNTIYFGDGCYGIESASNHYFSKSTKDLDLNEACVLAGIIKSPNYYSPVMKPENCLKRKNLVLKELKKDEKISSLQYDENINKSIVLNISTDKTNKLNSYSQNAIVEASKILKLPAKQIALAEYKIYTFQDNDKQNAINNAFEQLKTDDDCALISMNKFGHIQAFIGKSDYKILETKRQPGSSIKPILVYAPAINEDIISPATQLLDEPINLDGYSPQNIGGSYSGYISAREALAKSLNIPTIKVSSYVGIEKMKSYAKQMGITFDKNDTSYSISLGGMTHGTTLLELTGAYTTLANSGNFSQPKFISYITDKNGKIVYKSNIDTKRILRDDTSYLVTDMLKSSTKIGTAKKLNALNYDIASKTGTVGNKNGNTDAYNISYTTEDIFGAWIGNMDNSKIKTVGGGIPTEMAKVYFNEIYSQHKPNNFLKPSSVEEVDLDSIELEKNHRVVKANSLIPEKHRVKEIFSKFNLPKEESTNYIMVSPAKLAGKIENENVCLFLNAENFIEYEIYKEMNGKTKLIDTISNKQGKIVINDKLKYGNKATYYCISKIKNYALNTENISEKSNEIELVASKKASNKWYY